MNPSSRTLNTINESDPFAIRYWAKQLRISEGDLRKAIAAVGPSTQAVRQYTGHAARPQAGRGTGPRNAKRQGE